MKRMPLSLRALAVAAVAVAAYASSVGSAHAATFSKLVIFGDSLSDSGNNSLLPMVGGDPMQVITGNSYVPAQTYQFAPTGTYSNGPVWASYFAAGLGLSNVAALADGNNYAFGGATTGPGSLTPNMLVQTGAFLANNGGLADPNALYVVAGGGNNVRATLDAVLSDPGNAPSIVNNAVAGYVNDVGGIVDALQAAGAVNIVVWNTPNLGLTPAALAQGLGASQFATGVAMAMNMALDARLASEAGVLKFDVFGVGSWVAQNPDVLGFTNTVDACGAVAGADCSKYLWWDGIHPTSTAHMVIGMAMVDRVAAIPEPQTYALFALGLLGVAAAARRQRGPR
jgi:outer membrane lipase/esterase